MAKPRIFISSTYYDLKHIRTSLEGFISNMGYEAILFEKGDIVFNHKNPLDISCYAEVNNCDIFVLIIGGRYGSPSSDSDDSVSEKNFNSITKKEYQTAREKDIPIYIFIEKNVLSEYQTYKRNRDNEEVEYAYVDNRQIFLLIDEIYEQRRNNLIREFDSFSDISSWLREQWAGLFSELLSKNSEKQELSDLSNQIQDLKGVSSVLKEYSELIVKELKPKNYKKIIEEQEKKMRNNMAMMSRFRRNPLVSYLRRKTNLSFDELFSMFLSSPNINELFNNLGLNEENKDVLDMAEHDFKILKTFIT